MGNPAELYMVPSLFCYQPYSCRSSSQLYIREYGSFPLSQQMEFNSRLLKLDDDADIMEELKGLTPEQLKALIAMVKKS